MGSGDGTVRMWNLGSGRPVTQDIPRVITFSPSGKMVAQTKRSAYVELWDTATWEAVEPRDVEHESEIAFSADDHRVAILSNYLITICDIMHLENRLSFDPWPKGGRSVCIKKVAFQTCNICTSCETMTQMRSQGYSRSGK